MQYGMMPKLMWLAFRGTFQKALVSELQIGHTRTVMEHAHKDYRKILAEVDEFEKGNRF